MKKKLFTLNLVKYLTLILMCVMCLQANVSYAQPATVTIPVGIGRPCGTGSTRDSLKYYNYNDVTNVLTHRSNCEPNLVSPGFSDNFATIQFNPYDGYLYFGQITGPVSGQYTTHIYRWLPTTCPNGAALAKYTVYDNQLVIGIEFDPATGLGYQINFVDTTGVPAISYDAPGNVGTFISSAVINGRPASAHYDDTNDDLHYSRANDAQGVSWAAAINVATTGNVGQHPSLNTVNGNPAIAYHDVTNNRLMYVRATNVNGTAWGTPVVVDDPPGSTNVGQFNSLVVVNGNPAIAYYDVTNGDLKFVRATNADGTAWGTPLVLDAANSGQFLSMQIVNNNPAISYYDNGNGDLKYIRATNVNGTAWSAPLSIVTASNVGQHTSLAVINGNPAISFYHVTNQDLQYIRATNADGTAWGAVSTVATTNNSGTFSCLKSVNGNPAIAYYYADNQDLKYIRATDANGITWGPEKTPEAANSVGQYANLLIVDGNPSIAYYDASNLNARFIRSYDNVGDQWYANSGVYDMELQQVDFANNALGVSRPIDFGSRYIYRQSGDMVMTPSRQMLAAFDNKYFTINWQDYATANPLVATYIDTLNVGAGNNLVGLAYASGKLVSSVRATSMCSSFHREIDILTGALTPVTSTDIFTSADMTNIPTGLGAAKRLVSTTLVSAGTYDVVYELIIRNYGGTPVQNVQVYDTLNNINGLVNNISASITSFTAPAGFTANPSYNGKTLGNFNLLASPGTLSNIPGQNTITIRITCRISGILAGVVYNNSATVYGTNLFGDALRDVSTNGSQPDLNSNDKPDDVGENQPTPLLITVPAITPPCLALTNVLYTQNFGTGTGLAVVFPAPVVAAGVLLPTAGSSYIPSATQPLALDRFTVTNNANNADVGHFISLTDHTGNANGRMLVVNADAANTTMYRASFYSTTCANQQYSLSFYAAFPGNGSYQTLCDAFGGFRYPRIRMRIRDGISGLIITETSTIDITTNTWQQYGLRFLAPISYSQLIIELINDANGGCGNDVVLDDIQFGSCDPTPVVSASVAAGCMGAAATFTSTITDPTTIAGTTVYQWQVAPTATGVWGNITGATSANYTIPAVAPGDTGKYYRVLIAAAGNIGNANCRFASPGILLQGRLLSTAPTGATRNKNNVCPLIQVQLAVVGGSLGDGAQWVWYAGSCSGTPIGTGATINVAAPFATTTYYVRAEGTCNVTSCQSVTIFISCNIDKDRDGIPDFVESYTFPARLTEAYNTAYPGFKDNNNDHINDDFQADGDSNGDGIPNYLDTTFPGRIDSNGDGIDDRFDMDLDGIINMLDLDSDNDGIPDVVEAGGVDADGDGRIDNYSDIDNDGLSQNVDASNIGVMFSGIGLGVPDLDGDGIPNAIDRDSDGDGIPDVVEVGGPDTNNDAIIDGFVDVNGDGLHDSYINFTGLLRTGADTNNDGRADSYPFKNFDRDGRANPYDLDSDGDGIVDVREAGFADTNYNGFEDGAIGTDGWSNTIRARGTNLGLLNTDGVGQPNYLDIDSDGDGIPDNIEGQTTISYRFPSGLDTDNDGLDDAYDLAPHASTFGGAGILLSDRDGDGIPDYMDLDTDADGQPDIVEGHDWNLDGIADEITTPLGIDSDGDGLDDRFDLINSTTNIKGTSSMMGTSGSLTGDATPGTRATVQRSTMSGCTFERDWRCVTGVLPVRYLQLSAAENKNMVSLSWGIISSMYLNGFEIERSIDNLNYQRIGSQSADITLDKLQNFSGLDNITDVNTNIIYYRIKVTAVNGQVKYSNVVVIRKDKKTTTFTVTPNPAKEVATVNFYTEKETMVTIRINDYIGKLVHLQTVKSARGNNVLPLTNLSKYSDGVYHVQLIINNEVQSVKLVIHN